jgi:hypothetical protein
MEPSDVQVKVTLMRRSATLEKKGVPVSAIVDPRAGLVVDIQPPVVDVVLMGYASGVPAPEEGRPIRALVDCMGRLTPGEFVLPVRVMAGGEVSAVTRPETVRVTLTQRASGD